MDPRETGLYLGQCAQYCGTQHAKCCCAYTSTREDDFDRWITEQRQTSSHSGDGVCRTAHLEQTACVNCHTMKARERMQTDGPNLPIL